MVQFSLKDVTAPDYNRKHAGNRHGKSLAPVMSAIRAEAVTGRV